MDRRNRGSLRTGRRSATGWHENRGGLPEAGTAPYKVETGPPFFIVTGSCNRHHRKVGESSSSKMRNSQPVLTPVAVDYQMIGIMPDFLIRLSWVTS